MCHGYPEEDSLNLNINEEKPAGKDEKYFSNTISINVSNSFIFLNIKHYLLNSFNVEYSLNSC